MAAMDTYIMKLGQVESISDDTDGGRIKARIIDDGKIATSDIPYAFPLLPKVFHVKPKVGECVLVILNNPNNQYSDRFYIGPIISQYQYIEKDEYNYGRGTAGSLINGRSIAPLEQLSMYDATKGSFPNDEEVALVGRTQDDIILKNGEIDIRCGIRGEAVDNDNPNLKGYVMYNTVDPAYIQLKRENNLCPTRYGDKDRGTNSVANIVADKINLISYSDPNQFNLTNNEELITKDEQKRILDNMHPATYADELIELLNLMRNCILTHVHPFSGLESCKTDPIKQLADYDMNQIKSDFVRIS